MPNTTAFDLVRIAIQKNDFDRLLLGNDVYQYRPAASSSPFNSDIMSILSAIYDNDYSISREELSLKYINAIYKIVNQYDGIVPVSCCLLFEAVRMANNQQLMNIPLGEISSALKKSIEQYCIKLKADKTGPGADWKDGMMGEMRRLSNNFYSRTGQRFVD